MFILSPICGNVALSLFKSMRHPEQFEIDPSLVIIHELKSCSESIYVYPAARLTSAYVFWCC